MDAPKVPRWERWGQFRDSIIGGLLANPPQGGELTEETKNGLARLGVAHETTLPSSPYMYVAPQDMWRPPSELARTGKGYAGYAT